jgi:hypothetical protein
MQAVGVQNIHEAPFGHASVVPADLPDSALRALCIQHPGAKLGISGKKRTETVQFVCILAARLRNPFGQSALLGRMFT